MQSRHSLTSFANIMAFWNIGFQKQDRTIPIGSPRSKQANSTIASVELQYATRNFVPCTESCLVSGQPAFTIFIRQLDCLTRTGVYQRNHVLRRLCPQSFSRSALTKSSTVTVLGTFALPKVPKTWTILYIINSNHTTAANTSSIHLRYPTYFKNTTG